MPTPLSPETWPIDVLGWILMTIIFIIVEVLTVSFFALFLAIGAGITAAFAFFSHNLLTQGFVFAGTSILSLVLARPLIQKALNLKAKPARLSNADALIGEPVLVLEEVSAYLGKVRVVHTGEEWTAYLYQCSSGDCLPVGQEGTVVKVDGAKLAITRHVEAP